MEPSIFEPSNVFGFCVLEKHCSYFLCDSILEHTFELEEVVFNTAFDQDTSAPLSFVGGLSDFGYVLPLSLGHTPIKMTFVDALFFDENSFLVRQDNIVCSDEGNSFVNHILFDDADIIPSLKVDKVAISMEFPFLFKLISLNIVVIYFFAKILEGISELGIHGDQNNIEGHSKNLSIKSIFFVLMRF